MFIDRALESVVREVSSTFPVLLVTGPRQVGKTTLLERVADENRQYVSLDDPVARQLAKEEPSLFLQRYEPPVIIDEIQYAPELLPYIKLHVDQNKRNGDFWLIGSQMFPMMKGVSESLAGRVGILPMQGLSASELNKLPNQPYTTEVNRLLSRLKIANKMTLQEVYNLIYKGSMPAVHTTEQSVERFYASYVDTYVHRDIKELSQVADEMQFQRFLIACAARTSQMVNYSELAKDVGISSPTAKNWLSLLVTSGIVVLVEPYFNNTLKRIVKAPNMYFMDTGLCAYLTRWTSSESLEVSAMSGAFFETFVVSEIIKSYLNGGKRPPLFYYRDSDQKEIDLIIEENGKLQPIEIKKSAHPKKDAGRHFVVLEKTGKKYEMGSIICMSDDLVPITKETWAVPLWLI
ncbi:ATP-binding protein [Fusibacter sp. 3D3]|uniref:ATP-binding protein n=1 Tax=Fusibacter sp. 3D3 TaxID=1048380 RepID=UPI00085338AD|nr:ATP-binding protein [Fusibacter sp. 3D3]GAU75929.1 ATPase component BioM of energizing module of biotin ECF transporter [Fusibacter sp. 3D3]